jgi:hypothetical protein
MGLYRKAEERHKFPPLKLVRILIFILKNKPPLLQKRGTVFSNDSLSYLLTVVLMHKLNSLDCVESKHEC